MNSRKFTTIISIPFLLSIQPITSAQEIIPAIVLPCLQHLSTRRTPIEKATISGNYREGTRTYYALNIHPPGVDYVWNAVVSADQSQCRVEDANPSGDVVSATAALPTAVAQGLTLSVLKNTIQRVGGPQKYQAFLLQTAQQSGNQLSLLPYEVWAIKQLGIRIPPSIKIVTPN